MRPVHSHRREASEPRRAIVRLLFSLALLALLALPDAPPTRTARAGINEWTTSGPDGWPGARAGD